MKILKKLTAGLLAAAMMLSFAACGTPEESESTEPPKAPSVTVNVSTLKGPTGMGMAQFMNEAKADAFYNKYNVTLASAPDQIQAAITGGNADIVACPINLASALYKKTNGAVQMLAINTLGVLYILENGNTITDIADLKGKTIYATGKGATPEYILNYVLEANGLTPGEDVKIEYVQEHAELATMIAAGKAKIAVLPEPNVTAAMLQNKDVRIVADMTEQWEKAATAQGNDSTLVQGCIIARKDFVEKNPQAVAEFMEAYEASVDLTKADKDTAAALCEEMGIIPKKAVALKAMDNCNITFIKGEEMKNLALDNLQILFEANPKSIGGAVPDENFFFMG